MTRNPSDSECATTRLEDLPAKCFSREAKPNEFPAIAEFVYKYQFMGISHNYLCAICREQRAVLDCNTGILHPCWKCQHTYQLVKLNWFDRLIGRSARGLK